MRRLLFILLMFCGTAWGQNQLPVPVQICDVIGTTCAFSNNVVSGNIIFIGAHSEGALTTPTDTRSTTWTLVDSHTGGAGAYLWCGILGSGGAETITLTGSLAFHGSTVAEFPISYGWTCTKDASANGATSSGTITTSSITTAQNGDLLLCYMSSSHSGGQPIPTNGGSFLAVQGENGSDAGTLAYRFAGTNGSYNCIFDGGDDANGGYVIAAFKPSGAFAVPTALPSGSLTNSYSYTPQCVGGVGAYTWTASSLPTGLSINSSTGAITGTPTGGTTTPSITCTAATSGAATLSSVPLTVNSSVGTISVVGTPCSATATNCSLGTVTSGNCIVVSSFITRTNIAPPTDSLGTIFRYVGAQFAPTGQLFLTGLWTGTATSTGADTVTLTTGISGITAVQVSNCQSSFTDVATSKAGVNAGSVTISGASLTTLAPGSEILSSIIGWTSGSTWTAGTGFAATAGNSGSSPMQGIAANESATGTYTPSFVQTGNADGHWAIWGVALRPSTSGVVNTNHRRAWVIER